VVSDNPNPSRQDHLSDVGSAPDDVLASGDPISPMGRSAPSRDDSSQGDSPDESPDAPLDEAAREDAAPDISADADKAADADESETVEEPEAPLEDESDDQDDASHDEPSGAAATGVGDDVVIEPEVITMDWYILKVQSNREKSITDALERRIRIAGLDEYFGEVVVPTEKVTEFKGGKKRVVRRKLYPGYIMVHMHINDDTWFLVRETPGIGDFTGAGGKPTPMLQHEVQRIITKTEEKTDEAPKLKINFNIGDRVKINEGTFENFEGEVSALDEASGRVTVMINIFGRSTPVELEYWQIESL
jgi:transcriptional antiterminator NusG